jgi:hypothetical protein
MFWFERCDYLGAGAHASQRAFFASGWRRCIIDLSQEDQYRQCGRPTGPGMAGMRWVNTNDNQWWYHENQDLKNWGWTMMIIYLNTCLGWCEKLPHLPHPEPWLVMSGKSSCQWWNDEWFCTTFRGPASKQTPQGFVPYHARKELPQTEDENPMPCVFVRSQCPSQV